jgi:hypothetical protein
MNGSDLAATDSIDTVSRRLPNGSGGGSNSMSSNNSMSNTNSHEPPPDLLTAS